MLEVICNFPRCSKLSCSSKGTIVVGWDCIGERKNYSAVIETEIKISFQKTAGWYARLRFLFCRDVSRRY
jgi:hypothetical protein